MYSIIKLIIATVTVFITTMFMQHMVGTYSADILGFQLNMSWLQCLATMTFFEIITGNYVAAVKASKIEESEMESVKTYIQSLLARLFGMGMILLALFFWY